MSVDLGFSSQKFYLAGRRKKQSAPAGLENNQTGAREDIRGRRNEAEGRPRSTDSPKSIVVIFVAGENRVSPEAEKCDRLPAVTIRGQEK